VGFCIYVGMFENESAYRVPTAAIRERFAGHIGSETNSTWRLAFDEGPSLAEVTLVGEDRIDGFAIDRPPDYRVFWEIIAGILRDFPCLLYWPYRKPTGVIGSLAVLPHIPKEFIQAMGIPLVSTDPERIRQYVRENS
jgi:hypothetical protein